MPASPATGSRKPLQPIPLTVLTGFLGAGKTTLLNQLLKDSALADTAVLIKEFGEISLDHLLVENVGDGMIMLASGCLCCTVRGDLVTALEKLLRDRDNGRVSFRRVVIETTGLADPAPVLHTIMAHPLSRAALSTRRGRHPRGRRLRALDARSASRSRQAGSGRRPAGAEQDRPTRGTTRGGSQTAADRTPTGAEPRRPDSRRGRRASDGIAAPRLRPVRSRPQDRRRAALAGRRGVCGCTRPCARRSRA